jgi:hypothetical protein
VKTSLPSPNKREAARIARIRQGGCVCCALLGLPNFQYLELHHILDGGVRIGHWFTIFLCRGHHQGDWSQRQRTLIPPAKLVSISDGRKAFIGAYDTERALWQRVQVAYNYDDSWIQSKILPRRIA